MNYGARSRAADRFRHRWPCTLPVPTDSRLQVIKWAAQMVLDHLFTGAHDFVIGQAFPDQNRNLTFRWAETRARCRDCPISFVNTASQLHPFTSSEDFGTQKQRAKVMFTVHRLMLSWSPIFLLLHPYTSKFETCLSRGVMLI